MPRFFAVSHKLNFVPYKMRNHRELQKSLQFLKQHSAFAVFHHKMFNFIACAIIKSNAFTHVHRTPADT